MQRESPAISAFKIWVFPSLVSIVSLMIWNDVNEIKADVKALMAQSNIDKTRIDNLERQMFKQTSDLPDEDNTLKINTIYAVLPNNDELKKAKTKKIKYDF
jgi:hypothetical protein